MKQGLIDRIELLGQAVEDGLIPRDEAAQMLADFSEGGLTLLGALDSIDNFKTRRAEYDRIFSDAARASGLLRAKIAALTPEEHEAAAVAWTAYSDQRRAAMKDELRDRLRRGGF